MTGTGQEPPVARQEETVAVAEAARRLGRSADAVRSALRRGTLPGYRDNRGGWRVLVAGLPGAAPPDVVAAPALDALRQELDRLHAELRQARDATEAARRQAGDRRRAARAAGPG